MRREPPTANPRKGEAPPEDHTETGRFGSEQGDEDEARIPPNRRGVAIR